MTTSSKNLTDTGEREAVAERAAEKAIEKAKAAAATTPPPASSAEALRALQWQECEECGPVAKLRKDLEKERTEREKTMKKAIALATFILAMVSGGIQIWGKLTARAEASAEMVQALKELRSEVKASRTVEAGK